MLYGGKKESSAPKWIVAPILKCMNKDGNCNDQAQ